ncbi:MAG: tRNA (adenosine(37)-N6)-threonylcarbamoyltransferase complex dimerization subunit type 1 TsaB [Dokdonella sp.]
MKLLAIETATEFCSVALLWDGQLISRGELAPRRHAEILLPMCNEVLAEAGVARNQLDAIAVGCGPGAFTGVRLAISAAQGIALGIDRPIVAVSSLAALAMCAPDNGAPTLAIIDARMGEIYAGCFVRDPHWLIRASGPESVGPADGLELPTEAANFVGTGWDTYKAVLKARFHEALLHCDGSCYPQADRVALLAQPMFAAGMAIDPADVRPTYLRDNVALTIAQQQQRRSHLTAGSA